MYLLTTLQGVFIVTNLFVSVILEGMAERHEKHLQELQAEAEKAKLTADMCRLRGEGPPVPRHKRLWRQLEARLPCLSRRCGASSGGGDGSEAPPGYPRGKYPKIMAPPAPYRQTDAKRRCTGARQGRCPGVGAGGVPG